MLIPDGTPEPVGTVVVGAVEGQIANMAREILDRRTCRVVRYSLETTRKTDMDICGGQVELLIESFEVATASEGVSVSGRDRE